MCANSVNRCLLVLALAWSSTALAKLSCTLSSATVAFGLYDPTAAVGDAATGTINVNCNGSFNAVLSLSIGNGAGASYSGGRLMTRTGGQTLLYNLYTTNLLTQVFGDGTGGSFKVNVSGNPRASQPIWGFMPAQQSGVPAGSYLDTIVATISY